MRAQPQPVIPVTVLETKLYVPRPRPGQVSRPRLRERLDRATRATLVLVSAPAGFGKTTLLTEWLAASSADGGRRTAAWLSLDAGDNDPAHFWTYVIAGLRSLVPDMGASALELLQSPQALPVEAVLTTLINDLGTVDGDVVLVLDDYHVIESREVHDAMGFLLDHLPPQLHLVISSRADPPLPLARLRAGGELVEVRAADLRFTAEEAAAYLNDAMGLQLTAPDVAALEGRTEGWIAALQLAALSMQGRADAGDFIAGFAGDDRYVVDYLVEEVVQRQPQPVQDFLLRTSVLTRMSGPLCDAVAGSTGGKAMLQALERGNLFLVPLDDQRRWYRYHHLFADVLQARLMDEHPELLPDLHAAASRWYADNGEPAEAIRHAMAGGDVQQAADLVERTLAAVRRDRQDALLRSWLEALPEDVIRVRPVLCIAAAGSLLSTAEVEGVERRLRDAERWRDLVFDDAGRQGERPPELVVVNEQEFAWLPTWVSIYRAGLALALGDGPATVLHARRALEVLDEDDVVGLGAATALIGLASWGTGDLATTYAAYVSCLTTFERAGHVADVMGIAITVGDLCVAFGRLDEAMGTYESALALAAAQGGPAPRGSADMYVGISGVHFERGDLGAAHAALLRCRELGEHLGLPQNRYRSRVAMARLLEAEGDLDGALELLDEAERLYVGDFSPRVRPVPARKARVWVKQGRLDDVRSWARREGLAPDDELSYLREFEHVTLARALLVEDRLDEAAGLLDRLQEAAQSGGRTGAVIEVLVLRALVAQRQGDPRTALAAVSRALELAEPEGHVQVFVDEGEPMASLLRAAAASGHGPAYLHRLLAGQGATAPSSRRPRSGDPVEPLSERERDVLRLLATDLSGPEIARRLVVSLNTVRTHTKNIYAKLGVNSRRAAVRRAEELDL
ncbi:LuxR C-terminal-related transcriptional regulator [Nocardioides sp.]|uniref:LuxR C-terminal-related transcriptional regulator n=1 Tax=Nocardioides sp. TaxID=35761 RepID=UPI001A2662D4|nr:LuxR C-terminal-related transcriptional regulator [Nocardioides sp.]MBJ7356093.1 helix-turn-helix transcriptional regulator [Nocardioides sp.]